MTVTIGHHCSGKCWSYWTESAIFPRCLRLSARARANVRPDLPHQAQRLRANLQSAVHRQCREEAAVGVEESARKVEFSLFLRQISMDAGANGVGGDIRIMETVCLENVEICLDFDVVWSIFSGRVICNGVDEIP